MDKESLFCYQTGQLSDYDMASEYADNIYMHENCTFNAQETLELCNRFDIAVDVDSLEEALLFSGENYLSSDNFDIEGAKLLIQGVRKAPAKKQVASKTPLVFLP